MESVVLPATDCSSRDVCNQCGAVHAEDHTPLNICNQMDIISTTSSYVHTARSEITHEVSPAQAERLSSL